MLYPMPSTPNVKNLPSIPTLDLANTKGFKWAAITIPCTQAIFPPRSERRRNGPGIDWSHDAQNFCVFDYDNLCMFLSFCLHEL